MNIWRFAQQRLSLSASLHYLKVLPLLLLPITASYATKDWAGLLVVL